MVNQERLLDEFFKMTQISSPSKKEGRFAQYLKLVLEDIGLEVEIDGAGEIVGGDTGNVIARLKGNEAYRSLIFSAHMDTVEPCEDIEPIIDGKRIISKGDNILSADDKGGIAAIVEALRVLKENHLPHGNLEVVFTICEETGMHGAKNLDVHKLEGELCFIFDSDGKPGTIVKQGPAKDIIKAVVKGIRSHAGLSPEEGVSAILIAADAVSKMKLLRVDSETTANIGTFHGTMATNVVCDEVAIIAEARSLSNEKLDSQTKHMIDCLENSAEKYGGKVEIDVHRSYGAFHLEEEEYGIILTKKAVTNLGLQVNLVATGGGSDANILNNMGIPSIDLGIGMTDVHSSKEYIEINDLVDTTKLVLELIKHAKK